MVRRRSCAAAAPGWQFGRVRVVVRVVGRSASTVRRRRVRPHSGVVVRVPVRCGRRRRRSHCRMVRVRVRGRIVPVRRVVVHGVRLQIVVRHREVVMRMMRGIGVRMRIVFGFIDMLLIVRGFRLEAGRRNRIWRRALGGATIADLLLFGTGTGAGIGVLVGVAGRGSHSGRRQRPQGARGAEGWGGFVRREERRSVLVLLLLRFLARLARPSSSNKRWHRLQRPSPLKIKVIELDRRRCSTSRYKAALHSRCVRPATTSFSTTHFSLDERGPLENPSNSLFRPVAHRSLPEICEDGGLKSCWIVELLVLVWGHG